MQLGTGQLGTHGMLQCEVSVASLVGLTLLLSIIIIIKLPN
jgi:hypothetical protein